MTTPNPLLEAAQSVLQEAGFSVGIGPLEQSGYSWLLAENELFVLGAIAGETLEDLKLLEGIASKALLDRLAGPEVGAKKWDIYLVLLTPQPWSSIDSRERVSLLYNIKGLRRLVGAGLNPGIGGDVRGAVAKVLRPFLPLPDHLETGLAGLEDDLVKALVVNGVNPDWAPHYVAAYRTEGSLESV